MGDVLLLKHHLGFDREHVLPDDCYVKIEHGCVLCVYRAVVEPWSGDGIPPAGTICEVDGSPGPDGWGKCTVLYSSADVIVFKRDAYDFESFSPAGTDSFRPIRMPEQIEAESREKTIDELKGVFDSISHELCATSNKYLETLFGAIHDRGYRRFEITDDSDPA